MKALIAGVELKVLDVITTSGEELVDYDTPLD